MGGNFDPKPVEGIFVAAGHSMNVVVSRDDGKTWKRVFYGSPCGDHGRWAVWNSVAYTEGVFAIAAGWGAPGTILASEDGANWRHLTNGSRKPSKNDARPYDMRTTMEFIGVDGAFIMPLEATPDFGKTWFQTSAYGFKDKAGDRIKVNLGHPSLACGNHSGEKRVIVIGDEGPAVYSDDLGKTWTPMNVKAEPWDEDRGAKGIIAKGNVFLIVKGSGKTVLRSTDGGMTWKAHPLGVKRPAGRSFGLSIVGDEFWVTGESSKASNDGITWRDLPEGTPSGRISVSDKGTLINVSRKRHSILREQNAFPKELSIEMIERALISLRPLILRAYRRAITMPEVDERQVFDALLRYRIQAEVSTDTTNIEIEFRPVDNSVGLGFCTFLAVFGGEVKR